MRNDVNGTCAAVYVERSAENEDGYPGDHRAFEPGADSPIAIVDLELGT
jgi:hypothetical protein